MQFSLGLSIVRELMERMGGQVSAQITEDILEIRLLFEVHDTKRDIP